MLCELQRAFSSTISPAYFHKTPAARQTPLAERLRRLDIDVHCGIAFLGAGDATHAFPNAHPAFDIVEEALATGIAMHVALAERALRA